MYERGRRRATSGCGTDRGAIVDSGFHVLAEGVGEYEPIVDNCERDYLQRPRWNCTPLLPPDELEQNRRIELRFAIFPGAFR